MNEILPLPQLNSVGDLNCEMERLCQAGDVDDALELLNQAQERMIVAASSNDGPFPDHNSYTILMQAWASRDATATPERLEPFLERMKELSKIYPACTPTALTYNAVILTWAKACTRQSGKRCDELMQELRSRYDETSNGAYLPLKATYVSTLAAWASSGRGKEAAERAEAILEEMEGLRLIHPHLAPTTICANIVL
jgi:pentatricopeptide repeat protein